MNEERTVMIGDDLPEIEGREKMAVPHGPLRTLSKALSFILSPLLMPIYATLMLLFGNSVMAHVPMKLKLYFTGVIALNTLIIPALSVGLLKTMGYVSDFSLFNRRERILPLVITAASYIVCAFMVSNIYVAFLIKKFLIAGLVCVLIALFITFFWKISIHMTGAGSVLGMMVLMNISGFASMFLPMIIGIILTGALASARLYLGAHTPAQVTAGFFLGFGITVMVLLIS